MQLQTLLVSLFLGLAAAAPQGFQFPDDVDNGCDQGTPLPGPRGTFCIGPKGENFGLARGSAPTTGCPPVTCLRLPHCDAVKGPDGCGKCTPGCEAF